MQCRQGIKDDTVCGFGKEPAGCMTNPAVTFTALGAGNGNSDGSFNNLKNNANFWSSTQNSSTNAYNYNLNYNNANANRNNNNKTNRYSVRCLRDSTGGGSGTPALFSRGYLELTDLFKAYFDARKNKRNTINALAFEIQYESKLLELYNDIVNFKYKPGKSIAFIVNYPVKREVFAADFRDRVVHHLIYNKINPVFDPSFIYDSYACRKGKGTLFGIQRIEHFIRSCSENYQKDCYILKLDLQGYFMSIDKAILFRKLLDKLESGNVQKKLSGISLELLIYLVERTVFHDPVKNYIRKGSIENWDGLPSTKSLFHAPPGKGLPIGNLTSQLFSNIYLNDFDHFMKEVLGAKYYGRYVDDFVIVHHDKMVLRNMIARIDDFLCHQLKLHIHPGKIYLQHFSKGVVFLGAVIKPYRKYLKNNIKGKFFSQMEKYRHIIALQDEVNRPLRKQIQSTINAYLGFMKHYDSWRLRKRLFLKYLKPEILCFFRYRSDYKKVTMN